MRCPNGVPSLHRLVLMLLVFPCQDIIRQSAVEVEIEVRPHFIVPDTNCFVDHLPQLRVLAGGQTFQLMVPVVGECSSPDPCSTRLRGNKVRSPLGVK